MEIFVLIGALLILGGLYHGLKGWREWQFWNWLFQEPPWWHFWHPGSGWMGGSLAAAILSLFVLGFLSYHWWFS